MDETIEDRELAGEIQEAALKLRDLIDNVGSRKMRHAMDDYLTRVYLLARDGHERNLNGGRGAQLWEAMNNQDGKWMPEAGQECEGQAESGAFFKCKILGVFQGAYPEAVCIVFQYEDGGIEAATEGNSYTFRPIKSEADKQREEQHKLLVEVIESKEYDDIDECAEALYDAGCRMTRELNYDAIRQAAIDAGLWGDRPQKLFVFAKAIADYVRGELEL